MAQPVDNSVGSRDHDDSHFNCVACERPDSADNIVACDHCENWWHYSCAGVTDSIAERNWTCSRCLPLPVAQGSTSSKLSSASRRQMLQLELQHLAERREYEKKQQDLELEKRFLEQKCKLLEATLEANDDEDRHSVRSRVIEIESRNRANSVASWVENHSKILGSSSMFQSGDNLPRIKITTNGEGAPEGANERGEVLTTPNAQGNREVNPNDLQLLHQQLAQCQRNSSPSFQQLQHLQELIRKCQLQMNNHRTTGTIPKIDRKNEMKNKTVQPFPVPKPIPIEKQRNPQLISIPAPKPIPDPKPTPVPQPVPFPRIPSAEQLIPTPQLLPAPLPPNPIFRPSQEQLAARQVMPRDLPEFSGDPEEWPIFLSSFNNSTVACGYNNTENLARLQRCLKGSALKSVRYYLLTPESVPEVMRTLQTLFGRPDIIINKLIRNMRECPAPKADRLETLIEFGIMVRNLTQHLIIAGQHAHLMNPVLLQEVVEKLPTAVKLQWAQHLVAVPDATLQTFSDFMSLMIESVSKVCQPVGSQLRSKGFINAHDVTDNIETAKRNESTLGKRCPVCAEEDHRVRDCDQFKQCDVEDRWKHVHRAKLCRCCLNFHGRRACRSSVRCGVDGCQFRHHPLLHTVSSSKNLSENSFTSNHTYHHCGQSVLFRILPVTLHGVSKSINTFAFLDEGSTTTLIEQELIDQLGVKGPTVPLCLKWTANMTRMEGNSQIVTLHVSGVDYKRTHRLENARTVESLNLSPQTLRFSELQQRFPHLVGLPVHSYEDAYPRLLIGLRNLPLAVPQKVKEGNDGPCAVKTRLGWCVYGSLGNNHTDEHLNYHVCDCTPNEKLDAMLGAYFNAEDIGVQPTLMPESKEEVRAKAILQQTTHRVDGRFQTGLLWRYDDIELPDSFPMALRRLECLEKRMERDAMLKESVHRQIKDYQDKGYAHLATESELLNANPRRVWYLPLGAVTNPKKPGKIRLVWDAAAKVDGISLNSLLIPGPDLLTPLPFVLFRFRLFPVAISSDLKEMFHQISIIPSDRNSQRFLFRDNPTNPPQVFTMDVATFGATCSPSTAQFIKNKNAKQFEDQYPRAVDGILNSHYVDDYLDSFATVEEAQRVASEVRDIHSKAGFSFHGWSSNSSIVLEHLGEQSKSVAKDLTLSKINNFERVLGMHWIPEVDVLSFSTSFSEEIQMLFTTGAKPTKRQMLKCIMSLFDPLGLLACFLFHGKVLMQEAWRTGMKWDDVVNDKIYEQWKRWTQQFELVTQIQIPRCYFDGANDNLYSSLQVHVFVDASEIAYCAAVYFRVITPNGKPQCRLVAAKTKVAPLKYHSIPRLELMAAVLGVRLLNYTLQGHGIRHAQSFYWSDSKTVLAWIRSDHRRYQQFVACRVGEILTSSNETQWRWVPSKLNVADEATKWGKVFCFDDASRWFLGTNFLSLPESHWPSVKYLIPKTDEELRPCHLHQIIETNLLIDFKRFSNFNRLVRTVAFVKRFAERCMKRVPKPWHSKLTHEEFKDAQTFIWKQAQSDSYPDEMTILLRNRNFSIKAKSKIPKSSPLYKLTAFLDEYGVLRIDGRTRTAKWAPVDIKFPIILPKNHTVTHLLVDNYHRQFLHGNAETVVNEIRQQFYIPQLRVLARKLSRRCQWCVIYKAKPATPRMAPLPSARLSPYTRPFSYVGLDYFGPILVKVGRSSAKRWVALFTCLTIRAVHVEIAHDLSTQSCISCIRRFICRRGQPLEIHSDNGCNFSGASNILQKQIEKAVTESAVSFTNAKTKWVFIPPSSPHMGGSWERMVCSVKAAMTSLPQDRKLDDEALQTVAIEAEAIVNSRPLTYLPLDSEEQEALTPNHFILLSSTGINQPAVPMSDPIKAAFGTRALIQRNLDHFWKRWVREYLPTLTRRTKWFKETKPIEPGDLVIVIDVSKRNGWVRGRVKDILPGKDGRVRQAIVQTTGGLFRRSVSNLAVLDVSRDGNAELGTHRYGEGDVTTGAPQLATLHTETKRDLN
ncbi:uncharacterized protein LOC131694906 [Topomyia yanbarensis]|uniref:uncharacterized protein LOC131694906 n=1 Tax=Topomyia yanbarensis TaxID=2498891 RepID=UPI00273CA657|nr:uncharacterized protein LOC131694906 [Topomyia yanbarensis]